jgi:hypothetical protein
MYDRENNHKTLVNKKNYLSLYPTEHFFNLIIKINSMSLKKTLLWVLAAAVMALNPTTFHAADIVVSSTDDAGANTLRQAVLNAADGDEISFAPALAGATITLERNIEITKSITINGSGQKLVPDAEGFPAFSIPKLTADGAAEPVVTISRLWIEGFNNNARWWVEEDTGQNWGGAISSNKTGTLILKSCVFKNNTSSEGFGRTIVKVWFPNGTHIDDRFFAYGNTFISDVNEDFLFLHEEPGVLVGNVFYNTKNSSRSSHINTDNGTVQYNAYNGSGIGGGADGTNLQLTAYPFDDDLAPQGAALQILPATLPADYPEVDFAGNAIEGGGYAGAIQVQLVTGVLSITPSHKAIRITKGDAPVQLTATVAVSGISNDAVKWSSSNTAVATVDADGLVTAVAAGTADIIATADADDEFTATTTVQVLPLIGAGGYYTRDSWTVATHRMGGSGGSDFWSSNEDTEYWIKGYPQTITDEYEWSFWGVTAEDGELPNYIIVDMKQAIELTTVTITGPSDTHGDWMTGFWQNAVLYAATSEPRMTDFAIDYGTSFSNRNEKYWAWYSEVAPTFGDLDLDDVPSNWTQLDEVSDIVVENGVQTVVTFENIPEGTTARYLIVAFPGSNDGKRISLGDLKVKSKYLSATAKANVEGYGSITFSADKEIYTSGDNADITLSATVINPAVVTFDGWTLNGEDYSTDADATYNKAINDNLAFEAKYGLKLTGLFNSTGWPVGSNSGTQHRGNLESLVDTEELGDNHSAGDYSSRVKKYFTVEMPEAAIVNAVSLINTDGSVKHNDADGHASDFAGRRLSVYLTNTAPDADLNIDEGTPEEWGSEQGYTIAPIFDVSDNVADTATVVVAPTQTEYKYVILVIEHKNDYIEVAGIRIWGDFGAGIATVAASKEIKSVRSYDLLGRPATEATRGIIIKQITYRDGTTSTVKTLVREQ